ncbi:MAG: carbon-nitrogen hydrolase family protein [Proteobacteria bacterium]|nr:carbon-nitrogen hydrolase family protein [Pseudomonadota bacterium]
MKKPTTLTVACIQVNVGNDMQKNIKEAEALIRKAAKAKAQLIALPENVSFMAANQKDLLANSYTGKDHPGLLRFKALAKELKCWILIGSLAVKVSGSKKLRNRSYLLKPDGSIATYYDKIHLFNVTLPSGERYGESARYQAGDKLKVATTPWGKMGLTICYDIRFPHLFRALAHKGASLISVPAAFTYDTGVVHWHTLLKARAIENHAFIIAPGTTGNHPGGRKTFGHSLIIGPWGDVLAEADDKPGIIVAKLELARAHTIRESFPSLYHDRAFD